MPQTIDNAMQRIREENKDTRPRKTEKDILTSFAEYFRPELTKINVGLLEGKGKVETRTCEVARSLHVSQAELRWLSRGKRGENRHYSITISLVIFSGGNELYAQIVSRSLTDEQNSFIPAKSEEPLVKLRQLNIMPDKLDLFRAPEGFEIFKIYLANILLQLNKEGAFLLR